VEGEQNFARVFGTLGLEQGEASAGLEASDNSRGGALENLDDLVGVPSRLDSR